MMSSVDLVAPTPEVRPEWRVTEGDNGTISGTTLIEALTALARKRARIGMITGIALVAGIVTAFLLPVRYTATTRILTPQAAPSALSMLTAPTASSASVSLAAASGIGGLGLRNPNDIYAGLLSSRPIADKLIQKFDLMRVYRASDATEAHLKLTANTRIESEKSGLIAISVSDRDKFRAADLANAYTAELRQLTKDIAVTEAARRRVFFEEQLRRAKDALFTAQETFQKVQQKHGVVQLDAQTKEMIGRIAQIHAQIAEQQVELATLRSYSTEKNPAVQVAEQQLSTMQALAAKLEDQNGATGTSELGLQDVAGIGADYLHAEHELQYAQVMFDLMLKQYDAARLDEAKDAAVVQVVEPAVAPDRKSFPHRVSVVLLVTVLGFLAGSFYFFSIWLAQRDPKVVVSLLELKASLIGR